MNGAKPDLTSLVAGLAVLVFGAVLLLDSTGALDLKFAVLGPLACAAMGAILVARGLSRSG